MLSHNPQKIAIDRLDELQRRFCIVPKSGTSLGMRESALASLNGQDLTSVVSQPAD
jgi:hypothetical protein